MHKTARKIHKWLMLFLGIQFVIWSATGAYMVFFDIDYIHGDSLVTHHQTKIQTDKIDYSLKQLLQAYPGANNISVGTFIGQSVYRFTLADTPQQSTMLVSAMTGKVLSPLTESTAVTVAQHVYTGEGDIADITLITENPPFELSSRHLPAWRVNFDDFGSPSLYVSAQSGLLVGKRHEFWRWFDWMFRFHIMDYSSGEDIDNALLFWVALFASFAVVSGLVLTYFRVFKAKPNRRKRFNSSSVGAA